MSRLLTILAYLAFASTATVSAYPLPVSPLSALQQNKDYTGFLELIKTGGLTAFFSKRKFQGMIFVPNNKALNDYYKFVRLPLKTRQNKNWAANFVKAHTTFRVINDYKKIKLGKGVTLKVNSDDTVVIARVGNNAWKLFTKRDPTGSFLLGGPKKYGRKGFGARYIIQQVAGVQGKCTTPWEFINTTPGFYNYKKLVRFADVRGASPYSGNKAFPTYFKTNSFAGTIFIPNDAAFNAFFATINVTKIEVAFQKLKLKGVYGLIEGGIIPGTRLPTDKFPRVARAFRTPVTDGYSLLVGKSGLIDETGAKIKLTKPNLLACQTLIHVVDTVIQPDLGL